jgi:selenide, water dikinase
LIPQLQRRQYGMEPAAPVRLTTLAHGGGCGCKIAPSVLAQLLQRSQPARPHPQLLVGLETSDDAAVYRLNDTQALVSTTDFFMPIVDDPFDFGRIAACNALSDIYAMGGTPVLALALVGMPLNALPITVIREILRGGESLCGEAGIPIAGGHSIDSAEPIYGLAVTGLVHPGQIKRNSGARAGDLLVLGKPIGVGVLAAALKRGVLSESGYRALIETTTRLNRAGQELGRLEGVHAMTDVTGFGLLGHLLEMCRPAGLVAQVRLSQVPMLPGAIELATEGILTGASARNWASYEAEVQLGADISAIQRSLLCDPQTSGGLLVACAASELPEVLSVLRAHGGDVAAAIGGFIEGAPAAAERVVITS